MKFTTVDWFRVIWDMVQRGHNLAEIERRTRISSSTLRGYLDGSHPPHWRGELLVLLWADVCGTEPAKAPRTEVVLAPRVVQVSAAPTPAAEATLALDRAWRGKAA